MKECREEEEKRREEGYLGKRGRTQAVTKKFGGVQKLFLILSKQARPRFSTDRTLSALKCWKKS
jgi:hypothetical protein